MNSVTFTANVVKTSTIKRRKLFLGYKDQNVSIVELSCTDKNDMKALSDTVSNWERHGGEFVGDLHKNITSNHTPNVTRDHFYALTTQNENHKKLKSNNILGLMEFTEKSGDYDELLYLEVKPSTIMTKRFRKYKQIGKRLVEFAQEKFGEKGIEVRPSFTAGKYYEQFGFKQLSKKNCRVYWRAAR